MISVIKKVNLFKKRKRYCDIEIEKGPSGWKGTVEGLWSPDSI